MSGRARPLLACAALALACRSGTEPTYASVAGRYVAVSADGKALPVLPDTLSGAWSAGLADTFDLYANGTARHAFTIRWVERSIALDTVIHSVFQLTYHVSGHKFWTPYSCPIGAYCISNNTGTFGPSFLDLVTYSYGGGANTLFLRMDR